MEKDDHENRYARQPENDVAEHKVTPLSRESACRRSWFRSCRRRWSPRRPRSRSTDGSDVSCCRPYFVLLLQRSFRCLFPAERGCWGWDRRVGELHLKGDE